MIFLTTNEQVTTLRHRFHQLREHAVLVAEDLSTLDCRELDRLLYELHRLPHSGSHESLRDEILDTRLQCRELRALV